MPPGASSRSIFEKGPRVARDSEYRLGLLALPPGQPARECVVVDREARARNFEKRGRRFEATGDPIIVLETIAEQYAMDSLSRRGR